MSNNCVVYFFSVTKHFRMCITTPYFTGLQQVLIFGIDARILGGACVWATAAPRARDESFNIDNGDFYLMENIYRYVLFPTGP